MRAGAACNYNPQRQLLPDVSKHFKSCMTGFCCTAHQCSSLLGCRAIHVALKQNLSSLCRTSFDVLLNQKVGFSRFACGLECNNVPATSDARRQQCGQLQQCRDLMLEHARAHMHVCWNNHNAEAAATGSGAECRLTGGIFSAAHPPL